MKRLRRFQLCPVPVLCGARVLALAAALLLAACARNPVTGDADFVLMTEADEIRLGAKYHREILQQYKVYDDASLQAYVDELGQALAARSHRGKLAFTFTVLDSPQVNAFALPGGYVYITRGIMAYLNSEAELAGVIGHEIGHVTARHSVRQHSQSTLTGLVGSVLSAAAGNSSGNLFGALGQALTSGYGRDHELEADRLGARYLARAGYRPDNMIEVIGVLKDQEEFEKAQAQKEGREPRAYHGVFASHPRNDKRLREVVRAARDLGAENPRPDNRADYLARIGGMIYGPSEDQGVVRGNHFYHAGLGFALSVPDGWEIRNFPNYLRLLPPARDAFVQIDVRETQADGSAEGELLTRLGAEALDQQRELVSDFPAFTGLGEAQTPYGARTTRFVAWVVGEQVFMLAGAVENRDQRSDYDQQFLQIAATFRKLATGERARARALRIRVVQAPAGGYRALARNSPLENGAARLRLLNGQFPDGELRAGTPVKVIE